MDRRKLGTSYEEIAASYLEEQRIRIIKKNYRIRQGEVDLIGEDASHLVFFEVKYRNNIKFGEPYEAVSLSKQKRICRAAEHFLLTYGYEKQIRYDVVSILGEQISWYKDAFYHHEYY